MNVRHLHWKRAARTVLLILLLNVAGLTKAFAQEQFEADNLLYTIISTTPPQVSLDGHVDGTSASDELLIPESVVYGNVTYAVTTIGDNAFADCTDMYGDITIPNSVVTVGNYAFNNAGFDGSLSIGSSVTTIGSYAFANLGSTGGDLHIPNAVTTIGDHAFYQSYFDGTFSLSTSVISIGDYAFYNLTQLSVSPLALPNTLTYVGDYAFYHCSGMSGRLTLSTTLTSVGAHAFDGCGFTQLNFGSTNSSQLQSIGDYAFYSCSSMTGNLAFPLNIQSVGQYAFAYCGFTGNLNLRNMQTIGAYAFANVPFNSNGLTIPTSVTEIGVGAFYGSFQGGTLTINANLTIIPDYAFANTHFTESLIIPESVTTIGMFAFLYCEGFTGILTIPENTTSISGGAFYGCNGITVLNYNATNCNLPIDNGGYYGHGWVNACTALTTLNIGENVQSIPAYAFRYSYFTSITSHAETPPTFGNYAFQYADSSIPVYVPCNFEEAYSSLAWGGFSNFNGLCSGLVTVLADPLEGGTVTGGGFFEAGQLCTVTATANSNYCFANWTQNGMVASMNSEYVFSVAGDMTLVAHFVPEGNINFSDANVKAICVEHWDTNGDGELSYAEAASVTDLSNYFRYNSDLTSFDELQYFIGLSSIGNEAFIECSELTSIVIPNSVTTIGDYAFAYCNSLTGDLIIPNSVIRIGIRAFGYCSGLNGSLIIGNSVTTIDDNAFIGCSGFTGNLTIPNSVKTIGVGAFLDCAINGVLTIGTGVVNMGISAFRRCNGITAVQYNATNCQMIASDYEPWERPIFNECDNITSITIGDNVQTIPEYAFAYCSSHFAEIYVNSMTPPTLGDNVFSDANNTIPVYVPCNAVEIYQNASWGGFNSFNGICGGVIVVEADPVTGGTMAGAGTYEPGQYCTVTATANSGYAFVNWTINGVIVSTNIEYSFLVHSDVILVAHFVPEGNIVFADANVKAICVEHWDANGDGELSYVEAVSVTDLGYFFQTNSSITSFDELQYFMGLSAIGDWAFYNCNSLTSIVLPESILSINIGAFYQCSGLTGDLIIPNSVVSIGSYAFQSCSGLTGDLIIPNSVVSIGSYAFQSCSGLTGDLIIPNSVVSIGSSAFQSCSGFTGNLTIGENVTNIEDSAFKDCSGFTGDLIIPNSVVSIGSSAFQSCSGFTGSLTIGENVTNIGQSAFSSCSGFTTLYCFAATPPTLGPRGSFNSMNQNIYVYVPCDAVNAYQEASWGGFSNFHGLCAGSVTVSASPVEGGTVTGGGSFEGGQYCTVTATANADYTFANWTANGRVVSTSVEYSFPVEGDMTLVAHFVPEGNIVFADANVKAICIEHWDNNGDGELSYVEAASVTDLGTYFQYNSNLTSFDELQYFIGLSAIGYEAFYNCSGLTSIVLPESIMSIGNYAFCDCTGLTTMYCLAATPPSLGDDVFCSMNQNIPVYVPCNAVETYQNASWGGFSNFNGICGGVIVVEADPAVGGTTTGAGTYEAGQSCTVTATANTGYAFANWTANGAIVSTNSEYTFPVYGDMTIVAHFVAEGNIVFADANVKSICIANWDANGDGELSYAEAASVTDLGTYFQNNSSITSFDELQYFIGLSSIGEYAFYYCSGLTSITLPSSLTSIGNYAFYYCYGLTSITLPSSLTTIGNYAFYNCSNIQSITSLALVPPTIMGYYTLNYCYNKPLYIPCGTLEAYQNASYWSNFTNIQTELNDYFVQDGLRYEIISTNPPQVTLTGFAEGTNSAENLVIPASIYSECSGLDYAVTQIADNAFNGCTGLTGNLVLPNSLVTIGDFAFWNCTGLDGELTIPESVTRIGMRGFVNCRFTTVHYNAINCENMGWDENHETLYYVFWLNYNLQDIIIGENVTQIPDYAFGSRNSQNCHLTFMGNAVTRIGDYAFLHDEDNDLGLVGDLVIPSSVTEIGRQAFYGCSGLTEIWCKRTTRPTIYSNTFYDVDKSIPVHVPCGSISNYQSANYWSAFTNYSENPHILAVRSNDDYLGSATVTQYGTCSDNESIVHAEANPGGVFVNWTTLDGTFVSNNADYSFALTNDITLVANFMQLEGHHNFVGVGYWNDVDNWSPKELPTETSTVGIFGYVFLDDNATVASATVYNDYFIYIGSDAALTVTGTLTTSDNSRIYLDEGGQLYHASEGVNAELWRTITPYTTGEADGWHLIASPLEEEVEVNEVENLTVNEYDLYYYDEPTHYWMNQEYADNGFNTLENAKGYLYGNKGVASAQVGEGENTRSYVPIYTLYKYSISEQLFKADELSEAGVGGIINSLSWYATAVGQVPTQYGISIWMANVSDTYLTTTSHNTSNMTLVYYGSFTPQVGWNEFAFNRDDFVWDGTSNVLVCVQRNNGNWKSGLNWQTHTTNFNASGYKGTDSNAYNMSSNTYTITVVTERANTLFKCVARNTTIAFTGEVKNGTASVNVPLSYTETAGNVKGFNLVGNPYAHNVTSYGSVNVANGCYILNDAKDDLIVSEISEANPLKPAEGFFVKATAEDASITFNPQRGASISMAKSSSIRIEVSKDNKLVDRLIVKDSEGQSLEKLNLNEKRTQVFAIQDQKEVSIVPCEGNEQPFSFKASKDGNYTINVDAEDMEFSYLHLIDNLTGNDVNLLVEPSYSFEAKITDYASRFKLVFATGSSEDPESDSFAFLNSSGNLTIYGIEDEAILQVLDVLGHVLSSERFSGSYEKKLNVAPGVYMLRLINGDDVKVQKMVIK